MLVSSLSPAVECIGCGGNGGVLVNVFSFITDRFRTTGVFTVVLLFILHTFWGTFIVDGLLDMNVALDVLPDGVGGWIGRITLSRWPILRRATLLAEVVLLVLT